MKVITSGAEKQASKKKKLFFSLHKKDYTYKRIDIDASKKCGVVA